MIPQEMFSPFIEAAVDSMKRYVSDETALEAFSRMAWQRKKEWFWITQPFRHSDICLLKIR